MPKPLRVWIEEVAMKWPRTNGDEPDTDYQRGYMAACEEHAKALYEAVLNDRPEPRFVQVSATYGSRSVVATPCPFVAALRSDGTVWCAWVTGEPSQRIWQALPPPPA